MLISFHNDKNKFAHIQSNVTISVALFISIIVTSHIISALAIALGKVFLFGFL